ncbi:Uncharacterized protein APZ42_017775 [Daphnia magna]|uniref:Uncharacterized protein n=1 Tax=Daphnia magna TaxID=35525 RepID=A0A164ZLH7_9CRUS|nr:Uncharacterized protein APZ42_017775 [Daphnia magna]
MRIFTLAGILEEESIAQNEVQFQMIRQIRLDCKKFYLSAINQIQATFDFKDTSTYATSFTAQKSNEKIVSLLFQRYSLDSVIMPC